MAMKLLVLSALLVACNAGPVWINGDDYFPGVILRVGRSPSMAYGFGSSFSSNIGGVGHSTSIGSSFQSGDAEAYGAGVVDGTAYAKGVSIARAQPTPVFYSIPQGYQQSSATAYNNGYGRNSAVSQAQNIGDYSSAVSSAQNHGYGSAVSAARNVGLPRYQTAVSSAKNLGYSGYSGLGYNAATASAKSAGGDYGTAVSSAQSSDGLDYNAAVSAAENMGGYGGSSSQAFQQRAGVVQNSGASSINGPGLRAAHSHAVNTGLY